MKKLLMTTAVCGLAFAATPANAQVELELGGYFKGYGAYVDQDEAAGTAVNDFDFIRNTEVHLGGETTLDNGLTVGAHAEFAADGGEFTTDESYLYFSGNWGRINVGDEDGAGYLLQVAAPSADSNIDGIRQFVNPVNYGVIGGAGAGLFGAQFITAANGQGIDYDMDQSGKSTKLTYLSPILNGFQIGASWSPDTTNAAENGVGADNSAAEDTYEGALRYEGQFNNVGVIAGAGYVKTVDETAGGSDRDAWNVGLDLDVGAFGIGAIYTEDEGNGTTDEETIVVGVDYTTGPFKLGASYFDQEDSFTTTTDTVRYSGGVTYTYGPGMTFRGSIGYVEHDVAGTDVDATYVTLGTQVNF